MNDYLDFSFEMQPQVLSLSDYSKDDFIPYWSKLVADQLSLDYDAVRAIYDRDTDAHKTEEKTRVIWDYGKAKHVARVPSAFINGVKLDSFPGSADEWLNIFKAVYDSQWRPQESHDSLIF